MAFICEMVASCKAVDEDLRRVFSAVDKVGCKKGFRPEYEEMRKFFFEKLLNRRKMERFLNNYNWTML